MANWFTKLFGGAKKEEEQISPALSETRKEEAGDKDLSGNGENLTSEIPEVSSTPKTEATVEENPAAVEGNENRELK